MTSEKEPVETTTEETAGEATASDEGASEGTAPEEAATDEALERTDEGAIEEAPLPNGQGPDPVVGAGVTLTGIFIMALGGARDLHYVFDVGVLVAVLGAGIFVLFVALSAMKMRQSAKETTSDIVDTDLPHVS